ncbi:uncharacterized protein LOC143905440 [Temnothorax americanus]|uniref:uncharacterized protein LOC143905440 n=1 Tax=Temnothorax americanus TaxID=1964332 RepID=UPI004068D58F
MREIHQYSVLASENPTQKAEFMARYPTVAKVVDDFEGNHLKIIQDVGDDEFETEDKIRDEFDRLRFAVVGRYEKLARAARKADPPAPSSASRSAIRLPKLALPQFSGDLALWPTFIALFDAAVHNNLDVTVIEKFQHLLTSLSGEALGVVKHLPLTVENYPIAYDALQARYSDKRELAKQLSGQGVGFMLYNHLLEKLTPTLREKFEASHMSVDSPSFDQLKAAFEGAVFARTRHSVAVLGVNETKAATTRGLTSLVIRVKNRDDLRFPIEATVLPRITSPLPNHRVDSKDWSHLTGLPLADPEYHLPGSIDILLGADSFVSVLRDGRRTGRAGEPDAFNTAFGWVLMGAVSPALQVQPLHTFATTLESIDAAVEQFWRLEDVPEHPPRSEEDQRCIEFFERTTYRDHSGRFVVSYPFASGLPTFVDSRPIAVNRLRALERRFKSNPDVRQSYNAFMQDYLDSGHMTIASEAAPPDGRVYYLPHHGVHKLDSTTTKLRVVFDASAKGPNGLSLNDTILSGPKLQPDIVAVLLLFRAKPVALTADFTPPCSNRCTSTTSWLASAPSVRPSRCEISSSNCSEAPVFELRKWASSHSEALEGLDPSICSDAMLSFESADDQVLKVLGLRWHSQSDTFGFQINPLNRNCTKRTILSEVARVFDPLGFLTPLTFTAKCLIQRLWTLKLEWDDEPPLEVRRQWERYQSEFDALTALRIPRTFPVGDNIRYELHGFCDASELGYGAVIYLRVVAPSESKRLLLCAKSKVAPLRAVSLPRLELCAALLLADLTAYVRQVLRGHTVIDTERAWSDSTVALCWIRSSPHRWKTFVRNRVARIQERIPIAAWGHVPTDQNPADHCSRGLFPRDLVASSMWWEGPEWLTDFETHVEPVLSEESLPREEERITSLVSLDPPGSLLALLDRFSSLDKICRIVAYVSRFLSRSRARPAPATLAVDQHESHSALLTLIKLVQLDSFEEEIDRLGHRKGLPKPFLKLAPFLDPTGLLRVGGRLIHSGLAYETKHPILLPNKHRLTDLIIEREHRANLHPGRRTLQYLLAQQFWILGVHRAIRRVLSACYKCFRANPRPSQPLMAELPVDRVSQVKPFSVSGVDFAGPFTLVTRRSARGLLV